MEFNMVKHLNNGRHINRKKFFFKKIEKKATQIRLNIFFKLQARILILFLFLIKTKWSMNGSKIVNSNNRDISTEKSKVNVQS